MYWVKMNSVECFVNSVIKSQNEPNFRHSRFVTDYLWKNDADGILNTYLFIPIKHSIAD